jgi:uncharacterized membrane protein
MQGLLLLLHVTGVVVWLGGMFFAVFCLHPALAALEQPARARLVTASLGRFLGWVAVCVVLIWASGIAMVSAVEARALPLGWHVMIGLGAVMTLVYLWIVFGLYRPARAALDRGEMSAVAPRLGHVRNLVILNLTLGLLAVASVLLLR